MNLIFKIIEHDKVNEQIIVKFCRQNSPKPIDDYPPVCIDCRNIDFDTTVESFIASIMRFGLSRIYQQESEEPILHENIPFSIEVEQVPEIDSVVNKVLSIHSDELINTALRMNKIKL